MNRKVKESLTFFFMGILAAFAAFCYMSTGFDRALGGDDKEFFVRMYLTTRDQSYLSLFVSYFKDCFHHIIHPALYGRYFCLTTMNYAVWKFASLSLTNYRAVILIYTLVAILLNAVFLYLFTDNKFLSVSSISLFPLLVNVFESVECNPLYTYQAITQRTFIFWIVGMIFMLLYYRKKHFYFLLVAGIGMFCACVTLEVGYMLVFASFFMIMGLECDIKKKIILFLPEAIAVLVAGTGYIICIKSQGMVGDTTVSLNVIAIIITAIKQFVTSFSVFATPIAIIKNGFSLSFIGISDVILSGILTGVMMFGLYHIAGLFEMKMFRRVTIYLAGLAMAILPACLMGIVGKFQEGGFITWFQGWIVSIIQVFGGVLIALIALYDLFSYLKNKVSDVAKRQAVIWLIGLVLVCIGIVSRSTARAYSEKNRLEYEILRDSVGSGTMADIPDGANICCDFDIWGGDVNAQSNFIWANADKILTARVYKDDLQASDEWFLSYSYKNKRQMGWLYAGRIGTGVNDLKDVTLWVEATTKEQILKRSIVYFVGSLEKEISFEEDKVLKLANGRYGYLIKISDFEDGAISDLVVK